MTCQILGRSSSRSLILLFGLFLAIGAVGCHSTVKAGFPALSAGMTEDEVRSLLGDPSVVVPGETGDGRVKITGPRWQYGDNLSTITTAAAFPRTIPDRVWVVWFDLDGRVVSWREPLLQASSSVESAPAADGRSAIFTSPMPSRNR